MIFLSENDMQKKRSGKNDDRERYWVEYQQEVPAEEVAPKHPILELVDESALARLQVYMSSCACRKRLSQV